MQIQQYVSTSRCKYIQMQVHAGASKCEYIQTHTSIVWNRSLDFRNLMRKPRSDKVTSTSSMALPNVLVVSFKAEPGEATADALPKMLVATLLAFVMSAKVFSSFSLTSAMALACVVDEPASHDYHYHYHHHYYYCYCYCYCYCYYYCQWFCYCYCYCYDCCY